MSRPVSGRFPDGPDFKVPMTNRTQKGSLVFFSGKMGAGKSTMAKRVAAEMQAVLLCEDEWLDALYPNRISSLDDYLKYSSRLRSPIKQLVQSILATGTDVVMDFPANTSSQREWFRTIFTEADAPHRLIYLDATDDLCLKQIEKRRASQPDRATRDTVEMFERVTKYFVAPATGDGFNITRVRVTQGEAST